MYRQFYYMPNLSLLAVNGRLRIMSIGYISSSNEIATFLSCLFSELFCVVIFNFLKIILLLPVSLVTALKPSAFFDFFFVLFA